MKPLVSVLMPAYNAQRWIEKAIASALSQTWPNVEVIVVDDGSTDDTLALARSIHSSSIKVVSQLNAGACAARNHAFSLAQGDMIQWLDADDLIAPDKIEKQMARAISAGSNKALISGPYGTFLKDPLRSVFASTSVWNDLSPRDFLIRKFTDNAHIVLHAWLIPRGLAQAAGPWDTRLQRTDADGEYACRLVCGSDQVLFVPDAYAYYRKGLQGSLSATRHYLDQEELLLRLLFGHLLALEDSEDTRNACVHWLQTWATSHYLVDRATPQVVQRLAAELRQSPVTIPLPRKVQLAENILGWQAARKTKAAAARTRTLLRRLFEGFERAA